MEVLHLGACQYQLVGRWHSGHAARSRLLNGFGVPVSPLFDLEIRVKARASWRLVHYLDTPQPILFRQLSLAFIYFR